jgi:hypothetical protein
MPTLEINTSLPSSIRFTWYYKIMSTSRCILFDHAHIGDQHIPSFVNSIRLVLQDYEQVILHTPQSCPHWRSSHPFLCWFNSPITTRLWACHVATPQSCPHWISTHFFLHRFDSLNTTWLWACHIAYPLIIPTLEINKSHILRRFDSLSTIRLWARHVAYSSIMPTLEINTSFSSLIQFA